MTHLVLRLRIVALLAFVASCGPGGGGAFGIEPQWLGADGGLCRVGMHPFDHFLVPGEMTTVRVGLAEICAKAVWDTSNKPVEVPTEVFVEVLDPSGAPFTHTHSGPIHEGFRPNVQNYVDVAFTPDRPGTWRISARFEPNIGGTVQEVEAIEWRGDAGVRELGWSVPSYCTQFGVTARGTVYCVRGYLGQELLTERGESFTQDAVAVDGDAIWRLVAIDGGIGIVDRLEDDGSSLRLTHRTQTSITLGRLAIDGDDVWLAGGRYTKGNTTLIRLHPEADGGLTRQTERSISGQAPSALVARGGEVLMMVTLSMDRTLIFAPADGGARGVPDAGDRYGVSYADSENIWTVINMSPTNAAGIDLSLYAMGLIAVTPAPGAARVATLLMPHQVQPEYTESPVPILAMSTRNNGAVTVGFVVPRPEGDRIRLEGYDAGPGYGPIVGATKSHAFAVSLDGGQLKIFDR